MLKNLQLIHEVIDSGMDSIDRFVREMCVDGGGLGTLVTQNLLDAAKIDAIFQKTCSVRMTQGVNRSIFFYAALTHDCLEGSLQTSW